MSTLLMTHAFQVLGGNLGLGPPYAMSLLTDMGNSIFRTCFLFFSSQILDALLSPYPTASLLGNLVSVSHDAIQDLGIFHIDHCETRLGFFNSHPDAHLLLLLPLQSHPRNAQTVPMQPLGGARVP